MPKRVTDDELELFNSYNIVDTEGEFSVEQYQKWFKHYVTESLKNNNTLMNVTEAIERANQISIEATKDKPIKDDIVPVNGLLNKEEFLTFINENVATDDLKNETKEMIKKLVENKPEENNDTEAPSKEEKVKDVKAVIAPLVKKCSIDNTLAKNIEEEIVDFLVDLGFSNDEVGEIIYSKDEEDMIDNSKNNNQKNPYTDWQYIYYMWTLGFDYSRFLFKNPKILGASKTGFKLDDEKESVKVDIKKIRTMNKAYSNEYHQLNNDYGIKISIDKIIDGLGKDNYKNYFKELVIQSYETGKSLITDSVDFISKLDNFCFKVSSTLSDSNYQPFGGMDNNEVRNLLINLRENDCNCTQKINNDLTKRFGSITKANPKKVSDYLEKQFREKYYEAEFKPDKYKDIMSEALATYKIYKDLHRTRGFGFRVFNNSNYAKEEQVLQGMEVLINKELNPQKKEFISDVLSQEVIFKASYKAELERINKFSLDLASNSYEIIDTDYGKTQIDISMDLDKEEIKESVNTEEVMMVNEK